MRNMAERFVHSWSELAETEHTLDELKAWIHDRNRNTEVDIKKTYMNEGDFWYYDFAEGRIRNRNGSFFSIAGLKLFREENEIFEQPIILQNEIGYLGILCKEINGVLHFLMQAKIEPGNINNVQISPTIQATRSNFTQKHGGRKPEFLDYFMDAEKHCIIFDQIQSEQSSRFYCKRNRNIMVYLGENTEVPLTDNYRWMTLGQLKELMKEDNLVNMDTRTVISCIPYAMWTLEDEEKRTVYEMFNDKALFSSIFEKRGLNGMVPVYRYINNRKMFNDTRTEIVPLDELDSWERTPEGVFCKEPADYKVIYCDIAIEGREVQRWKQPLFEAQGKAVFGLFTRISDDGRREFLVRGKEEIGCFDLMELGPAVQLEATFRTESLDCVERYFIEKYKKSSGVIKNVVLSEEGGRFYHEENRNIIIEVGCDEISDIPEGYFWMDFYTLNLMTQINNCLNIQLRNLLSLIDI